MNTIVNFYDYFIFKKFEVCVLAFSFIVSNIILIINVDISYLRNI